MNLPKKCTATKALLLFSSLIGAGAAWAAPAVGTVTDLAGALLAKRADGTVKILSQKSVVEQGDTLITEKDTFARIKFLDNSEIMLKPNSQFRIDKFSYEEAKKENDSAVFSLIKGGMRSVTGLVGKRSQDRFGVNTPAATIGIRGTTFFAEYTPGNDSKVASAYAMASVASVSTNYIMPDTFIDRIAMSDVPLNGLPSVMAPLQIAQAGQQSSTQDAQKSPGLYTFVVEGTINMTNQAGSQNYGQGESGYTSGPNSPPVKLPNSLSIQFEPPSSFKSSNGNSNNGNSQPLAVDCEVR